MSFDPDKEYGNEIDRTGFPSGAEHISAVIQDARKTLPPGTKFSFIAWSEGEIRKCGWIFNQQAEREKQKLYNPLKTELIA